MCALIGAARAPGPSTVDLSIARWVLRPKYVDYTMGVLCDYAAVSLYSCLWFAVYMYRRFAARPPMHRWEKNSVIKNSPCALTVFIFLHIFKRAFVNITICTAFSLTDRVVQCFNQRFRGGEPSKVYRTCFGDC